MAGDLFDRSESREFRNYFSTLPVMSIFASNPSSRSLFPLHSATPLQTLSSQSMPVVRTNISVLDTPRFGGRSACNVKFEQRPSTCGSSFCGWFGWQTHAPARYRTPPHPTPTSIHVIPQGWRRGEIYLRPRTSAAMTNRSSFDQPAPGAHTTIHFVCCYALFFKMALTTSPPPTAMRKIHWAGCLLSFFVTFPGSATLRMATAVSMSRGGGLGRVRPVPAGKVLFRDR